jgi:hypothetical protein
VSAAAFAYVIGVADTAGCVLAARLSEDKAVVVMRAEKVADPIYNG